MSGEHARAEPVEDEASGAGSGPWRRLSWVALAAMLLALPVGLRVWVDGRSELAAAEQAAAAGDRDAEVRHLGRAARFRLPLVRHDDRAREQLLALASEASDAGEVELGLAAWRELRRALLGTRALGVVDPTQLQAANAAIVELMVLDAQARGAPADASRWSAELEDDLQPRWRSLVAAACFAAWILASVGLFVAGIDNKGKLIPRPALRWGSFALGSLLAWLVLM